MEFKTQISGTKIYLTTLILQKIVKYFKIFDDWRNAWKTNLNGRPTLVLQFKTRISGTKYYLTPFCFDKRSYKVLDHPKIALLISLGVQDTNQWGKTQSDTVLFLQKKIMKYYKTLDHQETSQNWLKWSLISVLQFKTIIVTKKK